MLDVVRLFVGIVRLHRSLWYLSERYQHFSPIKIFSIAACNVS